MSIIKNLVSGNANGSYTFSKQSKTEKSVAKEHTSSQKPAQSGTEASLKSPSVISDSVRNEPSVNVYKATEASAPAPQKQFTERQFAESPSRTENVDKDSMQKIVEDVISTISRKYKKQIATEGLPAYIKAQIEVTATEELGKYNLNNSQLASAKEQIMASVTGLGVLEKFLADEDITEIIVQRYDYILVLKQGRWIKVPEQFATEQQLQTTIQRIVNPIGRQINLQTPIVDGRLKDGSRVSAIIPPIAVDGATVTIRKFSHKMLSADDCVRSGELNGTMLSFLQKCVQAKCNIIISGGTNTGKTTLLNMLSASIPKDEMIITIEDTCELQLKSPNVRRLETRKTENANQVLEKDLVKEALRMCPQRIIVGEIRDGAIIDMIGAMSTGHEGSMCTVHADSPTQLINSRIPTLYSMAESNFSDATRNLQVGGALNLIVQIGFDTQNIRRITHIAKIAKATSTEIKLENLFMYNEEHQQFEATGYIPKDIIRKCRIRGIEMPESMFAKGEVM